MTRAVTVELLPHLRRARDHIDRHYQRALDLDQLAAVAGVSKFHFVRSFEAAYGETPIRYLTRRRIERAQDLLRAANLTVTEICMLVGFASLGSFSSRFTAAGGRESHRYRNRWAARGGPHMPGCYLFMRGVLDPVARRAPSPTSRIAQSERSTGPAGAAYGRHMITNISLVTVYCLDQDKARDFYVESWASSPAPTSPWARAFAGSPSATPASPSSRSP